MNARDFLLLVLCISFISDTVSFMICSYFERKKHIADVEVLPGNVSYEFFCSKCQKSICVYLDWTYDKCVAEDNIYCRNCGRKLNWSNVNLSFGHYVKPKTLTAKYKIVKKKEKV